MPFTPAHSAIVLPLLKSRRLSATGLIVGSLAPDFEYFFKFSVSSYVSHTWLGILYFNIPVALLLSGLFHLVVKQNLIQNLPLFFQSRFQDTLDFDFRKYLRVNYLGFIISAAIGAASHIFWDSFTHENGFFVKTLSIYQDTVVPYDGARYPLFYALQHFSTAIGLFLVVVYVLLKKREPITYSGASALYWVFIIAITVSITFIRFAVYAADYNIGNVVVSVISGFCIALIVTGLMKFRRKEIVT